MLGDTEDNFRYHWEGHTSSLRQGPSRIWSLPIRLDHWSLAPGLFLSPTPALGLQYVQPHWATRALFTTLCSHCANIQEKSSCNFKFLNLPYKYYCAIFLLLLEFLLSVTKPPIILFNGSLNFSMKMKRLKKIFSASESFNKTNVTLVLFTRFPLYILYIFFSCFNFFR